MQRAVAIDEARRPRRDQRPLRRPGEDQVQSDLEIRRVGQQLSEMWGKPVVIENKGGAGHNIGAAAVAKAPPDGYTLMVSESGTFVSNPYLYAKGSLPYDADTDFAPISGLASYTQALVTHPSLPVRTVAVVAAVDQLTVPIWS